MSTSLIDQGLDLMLYGMGTVFVFLTVMVAATSLMSALVQKLTPEEPAQPETSKSAHTAPSPQIRTAIEKAIALHRKG